jgi:hypothetical protein
MKNGIDSGPDEMNAKYPKKFVSEEAIFSYIV